MHLAFSASALRGRWSRCCHNYNISKVLSDSVGTGYVVYNYYFNWSSMESYWEDILTVFLREQDREVRHFALGHTANELQRQDLFFLTLKRVF